ncbi:ABC transporter substrate-binding protein [Psychrobacter pygoscelis]|uniref:ABC transporter substrate-binding protein n=1 Tax=Psychrobacter pygoscelis TaxID=2488563 RepID=UPI00103DBDAD|nr:ABC transporter substrate-binding protein [Psychrobacter pygoscelis]
MIKNRKKCLLLLSICLVLLLSTKAHITTQNQTNMQKGFPDGMKVYTPEWGVVATMIEMGHPPTAMGDKKLYPQIVSKPRLSLEIIDVGFRGQPSKEVMSQLKLDLMIDTTTYKLSTRLEDTHLPITMIDFGMQTNKRGKVPSWGKYANIVRLIGNSTNQTDQAERYIRDSHNRIIQAGHTIRQYIGDNRKIIVIEFLDNREIVVTPVSNAVSLAADMMGLELISLGLPDESGWLIKPVHSLYELPDDTCLIIKKPFSELFKYNFINSQIWQNSPFFKPNACIYFIDPVWVRGGMYTMVTFAESLERAVTTQTTNEFSYEYLAGKAVTATEAAQ